MAIYDVLQKYQVGGITVGGAWVVFTSSFLYPVGHDLNRSKCRCV